MSKKVNIIISVVGIISALAVLLIIAVVIAHGQNTQVNNDCEQMKYNWIERMNLWTAKSNGAIDLDGSLQAEKENILLDGRMIEQQCGATIFNY
jgi:hypothetical protein